jgi:hypothetical protein
MQHLVVRRGDRLAGCAVVLISADDVVHHVCIVHCQYSIGQQAAALTSAM